mgnify:CR=1 FL=1
MADLFDTIEPPRVPLAERMRPRSLDEVADRKSVV